MAGEERVRVEAIVTVEEYMELVRAVVERAYRAGLAGAVATLTDVELISIGGFMEDIGQTEPGKAYLEKPQTQQLRSAIENEMRRRVA